MRTFVGLDDFSAIERVVWVMKNGTVYKAP